MMLSSPPIPSGHTLKLYISSLLQMTLPGTALDTVYGKYILDYLHSLSEEKLCTTPNAGVAYAVCVMSSDYKDEKNKLNSYSLLINWRGLHAMGLSVADWNSLQHAGTCYSRSENLRCRDRNSTLLSWWKDAKMQSELDTVGCHWQDMLLPHYIQVSHVTVWPTTGHYLKNSMYLEDDYYGTFNTIMGDLDTLISLLQPG